MTNSYLLLISKTRYIVGMIHEITAFRNNHCNSATMSMHLQTESLIFLNRRVLFEFCN